MRAMESLAPKPYTIDYFVYTGDGEDYDELFHTDSLEIAKQYRDNNVQLHYDEACDETPLPYMQELLDQAIASGDTNTIEVYRNSIQRQRDAAKIYQDMGLTEYAADEYWPALRIGFKIIWAYLPPLREIGKITNEIGKQLDPTLNS